MWGGGKLVFRLRIVFLFLHFCLRFLTKRKRKHTSSLCSTLFPLCSLVSLDPFCRFLTCFHVFLVFRGVKNAYKAFPQFLFFLLLLQRKMSRKQTDEKVLLALLVKQMAASSASSASQKSRTQTASGITAAYTGNKGKAAGKQRVGPLPQKQRSASSSVSIVFRPSFVALNREVFHPKVHAKAVAFRENIDKRKREAMESQAAMEDQLAEQNLDGGEVPTDAAPVDETAGEGVPAEEPAAEGENADDAVAADPFAPRTAFLPSYIAANGGTDPNGATRCIIRIRGPTTLPLPPPPAPKPQAEHDEQQTTTTTVPPPKGSEEARAKKRKKNKARRKQQQKATMVVQSQRAVNYFRSGLFSALRKEFGAVLRKTPSPWADEIAKREEAIRAAQQPPAASHKDPVAPLKETKETSPAKGEKGPSKASPQPASAGKQQPPASKHAPSQPTGGKQPAAQKGKRK